MSAAEQRKLLEQLMGTDALDPRAGKRTHVDLHDPKICKSFLVDFCIHDLFANTKHDLGPCPRIHQEKYKMEYTAQKNRGQEFPDFEEEFERDLSKFVLDCNRRIETATARLEKTPEDIEKLNKATAELAKIDETINCGLLEVEELGKIGEINRALYEQSKLQSYRAEKETVERVIKGLSDVSGYSGHQKLQVCDTCGAYLSRLDSDKRLADHFIGKMHKGYIRMRTAYEDIKQKNQARRQQNKRSLRY